MSKFHFGLVHAPLTPFVDGKIDFATFDRAIEFHISQGAEGLAIPTHAGESVSLPAGERKALLERAIKRAAGRAPVIANVSEAGTGIALFGVDGTTITAKWQAWALRDAVINNNATSARRAGA